MKGYAVLAIVLGIYGVVVFTVARYVGQTFGLVPELALIPVSMFGGYLIGRFLAVVIP